MRNIVKLLKLFTEKIQPKEKQHHSITLSDDKNYVIQLTLVYNDKFIPLLFDEKELDRNPEEIFEETMKELKEKNYL
jgi:hypothetical protein